jgi:hypothetical protein
MTKCIACSSELPDHARFCGNCGTVQHTTLPNQLTRLSEPRLQTIIAPEIDPASTFIQNKDTPYLPISPAPAIHSYEQPVIRPEQNVLHHPQEQQKAAQVDITGPRVLPNSNQPPTSHLPFAHGTPQVSHLPSVQNTPQVSHLPSVQNTPQVNSNPPPSHFPPQAGHIAAPHPSAGGHFPAASPHTPAAFPGSHPAYSPHVPTSTPGGPAVYHQHAPHYQPSEAAFHQQAPHYQPSEFYQHPAHYQPGYLHPAAHGGHIAAHAGKAVATKTAGGLATKWVIIIVIGIVVVAGGGIGAAAYILTRPQPLISISSDYTVSGHPAGSAGTTLHFKGQQFSGNSSINFLLNGSSIPDAPHPTSDAKGNVSTELPITSAWKVGEDTLTASDANGNTSKTGVLIEVVAQGQDGTPGPFGAPPDNASFTVNASEQGQLDQGFGSFKYNETLIVTGHPNGGSVCGESDTGTAKHYDNLTAVDGTSYSADIATSCSGTYKGGHITYTETILSWVGTFNFSTGPDVCTLIAPGIDEQLSGSFTAQGVFSGTVQDNSFPQSDFSCKNGANNALIGGNGTWTGTYKLS